MSYILEALKKAQAERQLGSAPTIHALPIQAPAAVQPASSRLPMLAGAGVALVGAGALAVYALREPAPVRLAATPAPVSAAAAPVAPAVPVSPPAPPPVLVQAPPVPPPVAVQAKPAPARAAPPPKPVVAKAPEPVRQEPPPPAAPVEEHLPTLRELPEAIQREVPRVTFGGYIYAKNPADSLLLVDKSLRREGEEVAAGLVLEKLQSKSAIMNYRGTRYRVPY